MSHMSNRSTQRIMPGGKRTPDVPTDGRSSSNGARAPHAGNGSPPTSTTSNGSSSNGNSAAPRRRATAQSMAASQREISVSEFFAKNRHLLGFDNPRKAVLTTVKEAVDNAL